MQIHMKNFKGSHRHMEKMENEEYKVIYTHILIYFGIHGKNFKLVL